MPKPNRWEAFAREDAELYILGRSVPAGDEEARARFFQSGRETATWMLDQVAGELPGRDLAIEIGCGVGRVLIPMAGCFSRVIGVDAAPTMLKKLQANCAHFGIHNAEPRLVDEAWNGDGEADLVYSWLVFQHLEDPALVDSSVRRLADALRSGGAALLQFDTRPPSAVYRLRNALPDAVLPRPWRRGIRRMRRTPGWLAKLFVAAGLQLVRQIGPQTEEHVFILRKP
ncbi:MAG: class I SAM-dependent methyltransferase [Planctomycetota bacterium]|jgi:cyclopropane fatty-acyl-phospholipid synthase-like methyltransferase